MKSFAALAAALTLAACGSSSPPQNPGIPDAGIPSADKPDYLERLASPLDYARVQGEEGEVKWLGQAGKGLPPLDKPCFFQNTERYPGHITFLKTFPSLANIDFATYLDLVMKNASRVLWGGELKFFAGAIHPRTKARGVLAYFVYADDAVTEALTLDQLKEVDTRLKGCVPYAKDLLVLVANDEAQAGHFTAQTADLAARGVDVLDLRMLRPGGGTESYSLGESYGYLRIVPQGQRALDYGPRDVLVVEGSSEDLSLVAGLVTSLPQNLHSHVNLRLREKMIPNARVPDIYQNQVVTLLDAKLVHLTVTATEVRIEPALLEVAMKFWAAHHPMAPPPLADLNEVRLRPFDQIRASDAISVGVKAANLGELTQVLPPENRVVGGFAIPFSVYRDFMRDGGFQARLETLLADPRLANDSAFRRTALAAFQKDLENATVPPALLARLAEAAHTAFGDGYATMPTRFRSSSNVEDGTVISGAGLHDSARACPADDADADDAGPSLCLAPDERAQMQAELSRRQAELAAHPERDWLPAIIDDLTKDLSNERSMARALKKVYASLWNDRAFEERAYWGIDQRLAFMGIAVEPSFVLEKLDAVAVTNLDGGAGGPLYRVVSQAQGQGVVRPADPTLVAETLTFHRSPDNKPADVQILTASSLSPQPLWSEANLAALATALFAVHDHFATKIYPTLANPSIDVEIKLTRDDRVVLKQARPYLQDAP
jgi:pyruvate,water dikinase